MTIFNRNQVDFTKEPMFFGERLNIQRYDDFKYPIFEKLTKQMISLFWIPEEISLQKDRNDYQKLSEFEKFVFTSNLKYQTLLDSVQGRSPAIAFLPFVSIPELESAIITWDFFEMIHSRSYTYVIKNLYANSSDVFDNILNNVEIQKRADSVVRYYDDFIEYSNKYQQDKSSVDMRLLKKKLLLALMSINILEGIRFYVSFACTFAFGENKLLEGSAKIVSFIARDESKHLGITQNILNNCRKGLEGDDYVELYKECESEFMNMFDIAIKEEKAWASYLFTNGSMIGLNDKLLWNYVDYIAAKRMKTIGLQPLTNTTHNPLSWMDHWLNSKGLQVAPQESEIETYMIGAINANVSDNLFDGFEL